MSASQSADLRASLLQVINDKRPKGRPDGSLQSGSVLEETARRVNARQAGIEEALLTQFHELFRTGYLAWGFDLSNPDPPFFHLTEQGFRALAAFSRDPANSRGYLEYVSSRVALSPIALSYLREAIDCYVAGLVKAAAVMVGVAAESLVIELRDATVQKLKALGQTVPVAMNEWRSRTIATALQKFLESKRGTLPRELYERYEAYWPPFTHQIRSARNDAGHPASVDPVTEPTVHASLLIFPELANLTSSLQQWVANELN